MWREGLGENCEFGRYHPWVITCYYVLTIGITMFSLSPWFLAATAAFAWSYAVLLKGKKAVRGNLIMIVTVAGLMTLINTFFTHNGATVLFYINHNRVTLEAFAYGLCASVMLISVFLWFESFQVLMTSDKLIYLFGRLLPVIGLVISMIFRFIPLLRNRYEEIVMGQKCMGRSGQKGVVSRVRQLTKQVSILIAWSLEASIENADSMTARGYGLHGRTSFHLFHIERRDLLALLYLAVTGIPVIVGGVLGKTTMIFYPKLVWTWPDLPVLIFYLLLLLFPLVIDLSGEYRWKKSLSKM